MPLSSLSVLVYPGSFFVKTTRHVGLGVMEESDQTRLGEAWQQGVVILAWNAVRNGAADPVHGELPTPPQGIRRTTRRPESTHWVQSTEPTISRRARISSEFPAKGNSPIGCIGSIGSIGNFCPKSKAQSRGRAAVPSGRQPGAQRGAAAA
jgi:hypothetical protein